ncbi:phosphohydrolase [Undibacterium terreum]|uniref:Phosphohydrolase n=2 Tax=Undibacterium terreum TaxID=1224302 RepID=A0A916U742_9BURK|nr:phosphohydrolase [Undibacterium terreum]
MLLTNVEPLDELFDQYSTLLGADLPAYRNHVYRLINFCAALSDDSENRLQKLVVAGFFHDIGIWSAHTFDYLPPSDALAQAWLEANAKSAWSGEISAMIQQHHKLTRCDGDSGLGGLAEAFRQADWVDVTHGLISHGVPRAVLRAVFAAFPDAGFHLRLLQLSCRRLLSHPLDPLPMMRW